MFKKVYSLYSAFCTQPAFYSQSAVNRTFKFRLTFLILNSASRIGAYFMAECHIHDKREEKIPFSLYRDR